MCVELRRISSLRSGSTRPAGTRSAAPFAGFYARVTATLSIYGSILFDNMRRVAVGLRKRLSRRA